MLLLWILSLAASFLLPATGEVGSNFQRCTQFFLGGNPPSNLEPMNPARICQYYKGSYRFATMYDKVGRTPLFSAYKYHHTPGASQVDWKIEPQLALPDDRHRISMELPQTSGINSRELTKGQAVWKDYSNALPYDKGQLAPASHQAYEDSKAATYTFTNVVPQFKDLIKGEWGSFLRSMEKSTAGCRETYVIVGVVPSEDFISGCRVNKPSHIWAAVCCLTKKSENQSWGVIAENNQNKVKKISLKGLEKELNDKYGKENINLFNGACY